jgi:hypothetical protein
MSRHTDNTTKTTIKQAIDSFLLNCKVEGKSYGTIECYSDKLKGFLWNATNYNWPDDIMVITTQHLREFLAYLKRFLFNPMASCLAYRRDIRRTFFMIITDVSSAIKGCLTKFFNVSSIY